MKVNVHNGNLSQREINEYINYNNYSNSDMNYIYDENDKEDETNKSNNEQSSNNNEEDNDSEKIQDIKQNLGELIDEIYLISDALRIDIEDIIRK